MDGSSPRVWGTFLNRGTTRNDARFIPTCVGNIEKVPESRQAETVHPHVCGEHCGVGKKFNYPVGSSPRVWGTLNDPDIQSGVKRFIPTCVGNMSHRGRMGCLGSVHPHVCGEHCLTSMQACSTAVHPHVCGEHFNRFLQTSFFFGSSPRVWGT